MLVGGGVVRWGEASSTWRRALEDATQEERHLGDALHWLEQERVKVERAVERRRASLSDRGPPRQRRCREYTGCGGSRVRPNYQRARTRYTSANAGSLRLLWRNEDARGKLLQYGAYVRKSSICRIAWI